MNSYEFKELPKDSTNIAVALFSVNMKCFGVFKDLGKKGQAVGRQLESMVLIGGLEEWADVQW
jgi:hypothetical protein